jgi:sialidase-1
MKRLCFKIPALAVVLLNLFPVEAEEIRVDPTVPYSQKRAEITGEYVVCKQPQRYIGWPGIALAENGDMLMVFSGDRDWHVCPWGKIFLVRKAAGEAHFGEPEVIVNTLLDDRDPSLVVLNDGTILLTFFTSLAFADSKIERYKPYEKHSAKLSREIRDRYLGTWAVKSTDNGKTWSEPVASPTHTPGGPTLLSDGRLLLVRPSVYESTDNGASWQQICRIERNPETWNSRYAFLSEQHAVEVSPGHILGLSRYRQKGGSDIRLRQIDSYDGGRSWSEPKPTGMLGYPAHILKLKNGWLLASYGRRIAPMGQRACISTDGGKTWETENEIVLSNAIDQDSGHLGYPSSIEMPDGSIWTCYYQIHSEKDGEYPSLMATHWRIKEKVDDKASAAAADSKKDSPPPAETQDGNLVF